MATETVVGLDGKPVVEAQNDQPMEGIIQSLETALTEAKSGKLRAIFLVGLDSQGRQLRTWVWDERNLIRGETLLGAVEAAKLQFLTGVRGPLVS